MRYLTDTQIKALPNILALLIPTPGSAEYIWVLKASLRRAIVTGYTTGGDPLDGVTLQPLFICYGSAGSAGQSVTDDGPVMMDSIWLNIGSSWASLPIHEGNYSVDNTADRGVFLFSEQSPNYGGGDAANCLTAQMWFTRIPV